MANATADLCDLSKVTAYVTCERDGQLQLLLFEHPLAGIQLPAGSVELGEDLLAAAVREVDEETGLRGLHDPALLGSTRTELPRERRILLRDSVLRGPGQGAAPSGWLSRGLTVDLLELNAAQARIRSDELDYAQVPPAVISRREGWLDAAALGSVIIRHHVHLHHRGDGPSRWSQTADGHEFVPFWAPLVPRPEICDAQSEWLAFAYDQVLQRALQRS